MTAIQYAGLTDQGRLREENEDRWLADPQQGLYLVADGMGGMFGGALASQVVVEILPRLIRKRMRDLDQPDPSKVEHQVLAALSELSERLHNEAKSEFGSGAMGSTAVLALVGDRQALVAHMGDSRAYLLRDGRLRQLTTDHTVIQLLLDAGEITPDEVADHPARGQLTRFVGMPGEPLPEVQSIGLAAGDRLLLCSDGLSGMLSDEQILNVLEEESVPEAACRQLVAAANEAGGRDNVTVLLLSVASD